MSTVMSIRRNVSWQIIFCCRASPEPVLVISTVMIAVTLSVIPLCTALALLGAVLAIMGFFMGIIDTTANVSMIRLYGRDVSPFIHVSVPFFATPMVV